MIFESGYTFLVPLLWPVPLWVALSQTRLVSLPEKQCVLKTHHMVKEFVNGGRAVLETFIHSLINMINEFKFFLEHARRCSQNKKVQNLGFLS